MDYTQAEKREGLGIFQEEAAEVIQEASKILRTGPDFCRRNSDTPNMRYLQQEIADLTILLELCIEMGVIEQMTQEEFAEYKVFKLNKLREWSGLGFAIQRVQERNTF